MKRILSAFTLSAVLVGGAVPALAGEQTVTLSVNMYCPSCPHIVKRTLKSVAGVRRVNVSFTRQEAVIVFDDTKATTAMLIERLNAIGYENFEASVAPESAPTN